MRPERIGEMRGRAGLAAPLLIALALAVVFAASATADGTGTFGGYLPYAAGSSPYSVAIGDVNRDGRPDVVTANEGDSTVSVLLGVGDGSFLPEAVYTTGSMPRSVAIGDVNRDGKPDIVTANWAAQTVSVLRGNGDGTFLPEQHYTTDSGPLSVAIGDVNRDGNPDLVVATLVADNVTVLLGDGTGAFHPAPNYPTTGYHPYSVAVADLNGDAKPDLVTANQGDDNVSWLLGNGDGTFQAEQHYSTGTTPQSAAVGDLNGDGKPDIVAANAGDDNVFVLLGNGDGTFHTNPGNEVFGTDHSPYSVAVGDLNGDGRPDVVTANRNGSSVSVLLGNGDGTFQAKLDNSTGSASNPFSVAVGDVNGDGWPDLVTANHSLANVSVLLATAPDAGLIGLNSVSIVPTSGGVDSFDSSLGPYGASNHGTDALVTSNGLVSIGQAPFAGDVVSTQGSVRLTTRVAVVTGSVTAGGTVTNPGHIDGTVTESSPSPAISGPPVTACGAPYSARTGISGRDFVYSQRTGSLTVYSHGTVKLANGVYCFHNVLLGTDTRLKVTGPVTINLVGTLVAPTAKIINTADLPTDLRIYSSYSGAGGVAIGGGAHAYMTILAPRTGVTIVGGSFFGRIFAQTLKVRGAAAIHVDVH